MAYPRMLATASDAWMGEFINADTPTDQNQAVADAASRFAADPERRWDQNDAPDLLDYGVKNIYSTSGFDALSVMARLYNRPKTTNSVNLGPVDLSSSFVIVDAHREDLPIVYCSENFVNLTGYQLHEVLGRNCRFLQSPDGIVSKGSVREFVDNKVIFQLKRSIEMTEECQFTQINYKKGGKPFVNLITIIPVASQENPKEVRYFVGFQVDLEEQSKRILGRIGDGTYFYTPNTQSASSIGQVHMDKRPRSATPDKEADSVMQMPNVGNLILTEAHPSSAESPLLDYEPFLMDQDEQYINHTEEQLILRNLWTGMESLVDSMDSSQSASEEEKLQTKRRDSVKRVKIDNLGTTSLSTKALFDLQPDFLFILSSRGILLHVSPQMCKEQLGYEVKDVVGKMIGDLVHPNDSPSIARELRASNPLQKFNVTFRFQRKDGSHVWCEATGHKYELSNRKRTKCFLMSSRLRDLTCQTVVAQPESVWPRLCAYSHLPAHQACMLKMTRQGLILHASIGMTNFVGMTKPKTKRKDDVLQGKSLADLTANDVDKKRVQAELIAAGKAAWDNACSVVVEFAMRAARRAVPVRVELYPCGTIDSGYFVAFVEPLTQDFDQLALLPDDANLQQSSDVQTSFAVPASTPPAFDKATLDSLGTFLDITIDSSSLQHKHNWLKSQNVKLSALLNDFCK